MATAAQLPTPCAQVSDHALIRYLERAYHMNIAAIRAEMVP